MLLMMMGPNSAEALSLLPPLWVELIKNWNMYLMLVVECSLLYYLGEVLAINSFSHTLKNPLQSLVVIYFGFFSFIFFLHFRSANDRRHFFFVFRFYQHFLKGNNNSSNNNNFYIISSLIWMHMILKLESEGSTTVGLFLLLVTVPGAKLK